MSSDCVIMSKMDDTTKGASKNVNGKKYTNIQIHFTLC